MSQDFIFSIKEIRFDEDYHPAEKTRLTTNFANLARGENRRENLRNAIIMINNRFNSLAHADNPNSDRYKIDLDIVTAELAIEPGSTISRFPIIEILNTTIHDLHRDERIAGSVGNSFSSYVRDYDFSILLKTYVNDEGVPNLPDDFGRLHGQLFRSFINSAAYQSRFTKRPIICLSVSTSKTYCRTDYVHPVLGIEYRQDDYSLTDQYFAKMGMTVRYFMPNGSVAPLAFYFLGDLLADYHELELISAISTMESFQKIYRPEIYNANSQAGRQYRPSLRHSDYSTTQIVYDRDERSRLAVEQGKFAEETFMQPYKSALERWSARFVL